MCTRSSPNRSAHEGDSGRAGRLDKPTARTHPCGMNRGERQHLERTACARHQNTPRHMGYHSRYPGKTPGKLCSCWMCGNPRRHFGDRTRQELRASLDAPDFLRWEAENDEPTTGWWPPPGARYGEYGASALPCDCVACTGVAPETVEHFTRPKPALTHQPLAELAAA